jgi:uncharacterized protein with HEPN domain
MVCDAVARNLEIIGEAANRLSADFKANHSAVKWKEIRGFRNRLVHECFGVDFQWVWMVVQNEIPQLLSHLRALRG